MKPAYDNVRPVMIKRATYARMIAIHSANATPGKPHPCPAGAKLGPVLIALTGIGMGLLFWEILI